MRIRMKQTRRGSEDGYTLKNYEADREYDLEDTARGRDLGAVFIREGWAEEVKARAPKSDGGDPKPPAVEPKGDGDPKRRG